MDEMKLKSSWVRGIVGRIAGKQLGKKLGYDIELIVNEAEALIGDEEATVHLNLDAKMSKAELEKLIKNLV